MLDNAFGRSVNYNREVLRIQMRRGSSRGQAVFSQLRDHCKAIGITHVVVKAAELGVTEFGVHGLLESLPRLRGSSFFEIGNHSLSVLW